MALSRKEAQATIYRGCARLNMAMRIKRVSKDAAQKWENEVIREAKNILTVASKCPSMELIIPPLPLALIEEQKRLQKRRPLRPSDIHSPLEQASSSPMALWITHETDPEIPSHIDLGDPSTFWWTDFKEKVAKVNVPSDEDLEEDITAVSDSQVVGKQGQERGHDVGKSKRYRVDPPDEDEAKDVYVYDPKCNNCKDDRVCGVVRPGYACTPCKDRKLRCSARGESTAIRSSDTSIPIPAKKKPRVAEKSQSIIDVFRSQVVAGRSARETTPTAAERNGRGLATCTPSKRQRMYVAVPPSSSKASPRVQPWKVGPPKGKLKRHKRAKRAAARSPSPDSLDSPSRGMAVTRAPVTRTSAAASVGMPGSTTAVDRRMPPAGRVLVDKGVGTENTPLEKQSDTQTEFLKALVSLILDVVHQERAPEAD